MKIIKALLTVVVVAADKMRLRMDGSEFRILQFSDLNYEQEFSAKFMENVVNQENPQLVVLMGKTAENEKDLSSVLNFLMEK